MYFQVEHDTAKSMQMLLKLDSIKSRMTGAAEALQVGYFSYLLPDPFLYICWTMLKTKKNWIPFLITTVNN